MAILYDDKNKVFKLDTDATSYVFCLRHGRYLSHIYYGAKIDDTDVTDWKTGQVYAFSPYVKEIGERFSLDTELLEYSCFGTGDMRADALRIRRPNGCRDTLAVYAGHEIIEGRLPLNGLPHSRDAAGVQTLIITEEDPLSGARIKLCYSVYEKENVLARYQIIENIGKEPFFIEKSASCCLDFYYDEQKVISLPGGYGYEQRLQQAPLSEGILSFGSVAGTTSHKLNPFFAVAERSATEDGGCVIGCNLVYSGNFLNEIERTHKGCVRITAGINPAGFCWKLRPGQTFCTPEALLTFSDGGIGGMSRNFHSHILEHIVPVPRSEPRPVVLNTWEAFFFGVNEDLLLECAQKAVDLGIDTIVLDDGWFKNRPDDKSGLGDWEIDAEKFPSFAETVKKIKALGLRFGIWIEPEMVNEKSELFATHPEWCLSSGRIPSVQRNQLVLDMANEDVVEYLYRKFFKLLSCADISYVKWDMNRYLTEIGSAAFPADEQGEVAHRYVLGVYELYGKLRKDFPHVFFESCSGGGGRFDLGMLYFSPQIWLSDNTSPFDRAKMQYASTIAYPPAVISSHVTSGIGGCTFQNSDLEFRYLTSSNFSLGYEFDIRRLSEEETKKIAEYNEKYKKYRDLILHGKFYRIKSPFSCAYRVAVQLFVSEDKRRALLTVLQLNGDYNRLWETVRLKGLKKDGKYFCPQTGKTCSGNTLMNMGIFVDGLRGNGACRQYEFELKEEKE